MKNVIYLFVSIILLSCGTAKKTREALNTGNYYNAINTSVDRIADNKTKKSNQQYIYMLEDAYAKNMQRELETIEFLKKENNPANYEQIYTIYGQLNNIQERIKPLLPLHLNDEQRDARFKFKDYTDAILGAKSNLSEYLYSNATKLINNASTKYDYRKAYDDLKYLEQINPGFKDVKSKIEFSYAKGLDYVMVHLFNQSDKVLPQRLEEDLLNFNTYGLDDLWTSYHSNPQKSINYDYDLQIHFNDIAIGPEQISEKQVIKEKQVKDGWEYLKNSKGQVVKDSLGNDIKVDKFRTATCNFYRFSQRKDVHIAGTVTYINLRTGQAINSYPLTSGFVFEHEYARYDGDKLALDDDMIKLTGLKAVPFPSNEQMIYDAGEDLKNNIKAIIKKYPFN